MKVPVLIVGIILVFTKTEYGQSEEWEKLLHQLISKDAVEHAVALERLAKVTLPRLGDGKAKDIESDISAVVHEYEIDEPVRVQASAILFAVSLARLDSATVLNSATPALLRRFNDPVIQVRRNAVFTIANFKPDIPIELIPPLIDGLQNADLETVRASSFGLARGCKSSAADEALAAAFSADHDKPYRLTVIGAVRSVACDNKAIDNALGQTLTDTDSEIVLAAIDLAGAIGSRAASLKPQLTRLAQSNIDRKVATAAASVLSRLP